MKNLIKIIILKPYQYLNVLLNFIYNFSNIKMYQINYTSFPVIKGKLLVKNWGHCFIGKNVHFNSTVLSNLAGLYKPCTIYVLRGAILHIGENTGFSGVSIYCTNSISIGMYCNIGVNVAIWDTDFHPLDYLERRVTIESAKKAPIVIGDDVFVGANSIILKGVTIGNRSIIGAGSIVTRNIPADEVWAGNPAKFIRKVLE
jgi:serine acetyltransferase